MKRGAILIISGSILLISGNLAASLMSSAIPNDTVLFLKRSGNGIATNTNSFTHTVWLYDQENVTGYISTDSTQQTTFVKLVSPEGKPIFEKTFKRYLWLDFNTMLPPEEYTFIISQEEESSVEVTIVLNPPQNIDSKSKEIFREKSYVPNLLKLIDPVFEILGSVIIGSGLFLFLYDKNKTIWKNYKILLIGTLIFAVGVIFNFNHVSLVNGLVDFSLKVPIPQDFSDIDPSFYLSWDDYIFLMPLPYFIIFVAIIVIVLGGIKILQRRLSNKKSKM